MMQAGTVLFTVFLFVALPVTAGESADIPEARHHKWFFRQLRVGDQPQIRARTPDFEPLAWARYPRFPELVQQMLTHRPGFDPQPAGCYTGGYYLTASPEQAGGAFGYGVRHISRQGVRLEYPLNVPADGEYHILLRYENAGDASQDMSGRTAIAVDAGEPVPLGDLVRTAKGLRWARAGKITLAAGKRTLFWENVKGGELALDAIALCDDPTYEPRLLNYLDLAPPAPGKRLVVVQAECYAAQHGRKVRPWEKYSRLEEWSAYPARRTTLRFLPGTLAPMPASSDVEVLFFPESGWFNAVARLEEMDPDRGILALSGANCTRMILPHNRFCLVNALEALDMPGEWCLDGKLGRVYLWPMRKDFEQLGVVAPALDYAIELAGDPEKNEYVRWVHIEGFTITDTGFTAVDKLADPYFPNDAAVWLRGAAHCRIVNNTIRDVGGYGVCLAGPSHHNQVIGIVFYGQSITDQEWTQLLVDRLRERYPHTEIVAINRAIGGWGVPLLQKTIQYDVLWERPDVVCFHAYQGSFAQWERVLSSIRRHTTAEIVIRSAHIRRDERDRIDQPEGADVPVMSALAQKYDCELVECRQEWIEYLNAHNWDRQKLLRDGIHLSREGNVLMAQLYERHFQSNYSGRSADYPTVRRYDALYPLMTGRTDEILLTGGWHRVSEHDQCVQSDSAEDRLRRRGRQPDRLRLPKRQDPHVASRLAAR